MVITFAKFNFLAILIREFGDVSCYNPTGHLKWDVGHLSILTSMMTGFAHGDCAQLPERMIGPHT